MDRNHVSLILLIFISSLKQFSRLTFANEEVKAERSNLAGGDGRGGSSAYQVCISALALLVESRFTQACPQYPG
jgi:hypothetical protein